MRAFKASFEVGERDFAVMFMYSYLILNLRISF